MFWVFVRFGFFVVVFWALRFRVCDLGFRVLGFWRLRFRGWGSSFSCFRVLALRSSFSGSSFSTLPFLLILRSCKLQGMDEYFVAVIAQRFMTVSKF